MVRGTVKPSSRYGQDGRVLVFANREKAADALAAGATKVGADELIDKVGRRLPRLRAVVATPDLMGKVGRLGRVLGPRVSCPTRRPHRDDGRDEGCHRHPRAARSSSVSIATPTSTHHRQGVVGLDQLIDNYTRRWTRS